MEPIANPWTPPAAVSRQPEAAGAHVARQGGRDAPDLPREAVAAHPLSAAAGVSVATTTERFRPVAAACAPLADGATASALVAQLCERFRRDPDQALRAHPPPAAETALRLLDG